MNQQIIFSVGECVLGMVLVARSERGVCAILLGDEAGELVRGLQHRFPQAALRDAGAELELLVSNVANFIAAPATGLDVPLDVQGTAFQQRSSGKVRTQPERRISSNARNHECT